MHTAIPIDSDNYPRRLALTPGAPPVLYTHGNAPLNAPNTIAIVGTRSATPYALRFINNLVDDLARMLPQPVIVSGLALGCDIMAHRRAVECRVPTVAVLAHGLHTLYPAAHSQFARSMVAGDKGMLLTAYPEGTPVHRSNFLARNKIVAGISDCVVVAESAADRGGALHTARYAASIGRRVFACPGRIGDRYSSGCNMLIRGSAADPLRATASGAGRSHSRISHRQPRLHRRPDGRRPLHPHGQAAIHPDGNGVSRPDNHPPGQPLPQRLNPP